MTYSRCDLVSSVRHHGATVVVLLVAALACSSGSDKSTGDSDDVPGTSAPAREARQEARVHLSEAAYATAKIETAEVEAGSSAAEGAIEISGQVDFDSTRVAVISPRAPGRIERLAAAPGERVVRGQPVAHLSSPQFLTAQSDFVQASRRAAQLAGTPDAEGAAALASAARRRLLVRGASEGAIARLAAGGEPTLTLPVPAPFGGSILDVQALPGTAVEPGTPIFRMADLSTLTVVGDVPERSLAAVRAGAGAVVHVAAYPDVAFTGRVVRTKDALDPTTRTAKVVISVANARRQLKPGMFATVRLRAAVGAVSADGAVAERGLLTVPEAAVVTDGEMRYVFVQTAPRTFERRTVEVAPSASGVATPGLVVVRSGLTPGERIVVRGAFVLKSELAKAAFGEQEG
ncbi:MAG: efflux RND transporter periplasmic adaptor subunit [Gemmatimonadaceae bacterium]